MSTSIWKTIEGFSSYMVSDQVQVVRFMRPATDKSGCKIVCLTDDLGKQKNFKVHRLVMAAFHGSNDSTVNHKNLNKSNNALDNLEYMSSADNTRHAYASGAHSKDRHRAKIITFAEATELNKLNKVGGISVRRLSEVYGISHTTLFKYINSPEA